MRSVKLELISQMDSPLFLLSIHEAEALFLILKDSSGLSMTIKPGVNHIALTCGTTSYRIAPKLGSIKGDWSEDTCTDCIVIYTINNSERTAETEFRLDTGITLKSLINEIQHNVIKHSASEGHQGNFPYNSLMPVKSIGKAGDKLTSIFQSFVNPLNIA